MKAALALVLSGFSSAAIACPQLQGSWTCQFSDASTGKTTITQTGSGRSTVYTMLDTYLNLASTWQADGKTYPVTSGQLKGTKTASCIGDIGLQGQQSLSATDGSGIATSFTLTIQGENVLYGQQTATEMVEGQTLTPDTVSLMCQRDQ